MSVVVHLFDGAVYSFSDVSRFWLSSQYLVVDNVSDFSGKVFDLEDVEKFFVFAKGGEFDATCGFQEKR